MAEGATRRGVWWLIQGGRDRKRKGPESAGSLLGEPGREGEQAGGALRGLMVFQYRLEISNYFLTGALEVFAYALGPADSVAGAGQLTQGLVGR